MTYYIQISLWMIHLLGLSATPIDTVYKYNDGTTIQVIGINYADSIGLHGWVDSSRTYPIIMTKDTERVNIVKLSGSEIK